MQIPERFESKIERIPLAGCWIWVGAANRYGYIHVNGQSIVAHRAIWEMSNGKIPEGMELLHSCDIGVCVNPGHLSIGTHSDNMRDMVNKKRQRSVCGSAHWTHQDRQRARLIGQENIKKSHGSNEDNNNAKISQEIALQIRAHYASNPKLTMTELGSIFGLKREQTRKIVKGIVWKS